MVYYRIEGSGKNQKVNIEDYKEINEDGQYHYITHYYNGIADTTFQLPDTTIVKFNKIFNGSKKLKSYMVTDKLSGNQHFGGELQFFSCAYSNGTIDNFIVVAAFMDKSLYDVLFYRFKWPSKAAYKGQSVSNQSIERQILKYHNACKYIPKIEEPPTIK